MKKYAIMLAVVVLMFAAIRSAEAVILFDDRTAWEAAASAWSTVDMSGLPGTTLSAGTPLDVGYGESLTFDIDLSGRSIGSGWSTWSGGYTGPVLWTMGETSVTGLFTPCLLGGFGFEMEPNPFSFHEMTLQLADGSTLTQSVTGSSGAEFFGWVLEEGDVIASMTLSSDIDFAFGNMVIAEASPVVPEPISLFLFSSGLAGLATLRRKR